MKVSSTLIPIVLTLSSVLLLPATSSAAVATCFVAVDKAVPMTRVAFPNRVCIESIRVELVPLGGYLILDGISSEVRLVNRVPLVVAERTDNSVYVDAIVYSATGYNGPEAREDALLIVHLKLDRAGKIVGQPLMEGRLSRYFDHGPARFQIQTYRME